MEIICNPIQSQDIPLPTSSHGASQVGQPLHRLPNHKPLHRFNYHMDLDGLPDPMPLVLHHGTRHNLKMKM
ncbi:hypothetical protein RHSIM_Rhsim12G0050100 [Rhododendron simsii]|uniref:Uncharacterized protein n=1 Tax=Rhododendron simsii TaxID=118357 RepID=A0A834G3I7_RHOSS|nr:hypothetical protein RHSIM_Rhsim12G0050100 [Rhododendron simsii]